MSTVTRKKVIHKKKSKKLTPFLSSARLKETA